MRTSFNRKKITWAVMVLIVLAVSIAVSMLTAEFSFADGEDAPVKAYDSYQQAYEASKYTHETTLYFDPDDPEDYNEHEKTGKCGDDVTYKIYGELEWYTWEDTDTGEVIWSNYAVPRYLAVISGTGPTYDYEWEDVIDWTGVQEIIVEDGVTGIGKNFFNIVNDNNCIEKVTLPESLESIGAYAFHMSEHMKTINLPDSINYIGKYAFFCCSSLKEIHIPEGLTTINACSFYGLEKIKTLVIPDSVTEIKNSAFEFCYELSDIKWGTGLKKIGKYAFVDCDITELDIPDHVTSIGDSSFAVCEKLTKVRLSKNLQKIPAEAFERCKKLTQITIPTSSKISVIGDGAFERCESLKSITLPKSVKKIKDDAFWGCYKLRTIKFLGKKHFKFESYCVFTGDRIFSKKRTKNITIKCPNMSKKEKAKFRKYLKKDYIYFFGKVK